jgi:hypothetical protein
MAHEEIAVARLFADQIDQVQRLFYVIRVGMDKDGAVFEALGSLDIDIRHLCPVQPALFFFHLVPLLVEAMGGMHLAERFHGEEENQLKVRHTPADRFTVEGGDERFGEGSSSTDSERIRTDKNMV